MIQNDEGRKMMRGGRRAMDGGGTVGGADSRNGVDDPAVQYTRSVRDTVAARNPAGTGTSLAPNGYKSVSEGDGT